MTKLSAAEKVTRELDAYIDYFEKAKGRRPERLLVFPKQFKALQATYNHKPAEISYKGIPVEVST